MNNNLIIDAGFHKGEDTAFFLSKGYQVIAIDATKTLVEEGKIKFKGHIDSGQLILLNYAISNKSNEKIEFHISQFSQWNSCNYNVSNRLNNHVSTELVDTITLLDVIKKYGVPYYCKIDLEGMDEIAIRSLEVDFLPKYISCESECYGYNEQITMEEGLATLNALRDLGYNRFKLIDQKSLSELRTKRKLVIDSNTIAYTYKYRIVPRIGKLLPRYGTNQQRLSKELNYALTDGTSGPGPLHDKFRELSTWIDYVQIQDLIRFYRTQSLSHDGKNIWMDIHATIEN